MWGHHYSEFWEHELLGKVRRCNQNSGKYDPAHREHHTHIMWVLWYETHTPEDQYEGKIYTINATVFAEIFYNLYKISLSGSGIQSINSGYFQSWSSINAS